MESMLEYFDMLEDILDAGKTRPFSNKISIEREAIFDIIGEMRMNLPNEIRQARKIIEDHDRIIDDAKNKAASIIKESQERANELISEHEVYILAKETANEIVDEAKKNAREIRIGTMNYADEILSKSELAMRETLELLSNNFKELEEQFSNTVNTLYNNRQEIRGVKE